MKNRQKVKVVHCSHAMPASSPAIPSSAATPNWCLFFSIPDPFKIPCYIPFLKPLPCFFPINQSKPAHSHFLEAFLTLHYYPSQPGYSHQTEFAFKLTELWGQVWGPNKIVLWGGSMLATPAFGELAGLGAACNVLCVGWSVKCHLVQNKHQCQGNLHPCHTGTE